MQISAQNSKVDAQYLEEKKDVFLYQGEPYTGECYQNFPNGELGVKGRYVNGKKEGVWTWYYSNGNKKRESLYRNGLKSGKSNTWYISGKKRSEIIFNEDNNLKETRWDEKGKVIPRDSWESW